MRVGGDVTNISSFSAHLELRHILIIFPVCASDAFTDERQSSRGIIYNAFRQVIE